MVQRDRLLKLLAAGRCSQRALERCLGLVPAAFPQVGHTQVVERARQIGVLRTETLRLPACHLSQERFGETIILSPNGLVSERRKRLSCRDEASQLEMKGGEQAAGFGIVRVKREQFFESSGRPAILAGVHMRDGFFEESALLAVSDNTPLVHA